jgi:molybdenum cofactor cytidylyltransferase
MTIDPSRVSVILLAAGRSTRFGADKLRQPLAGRPIAHHAAHTLSRIPFAQRIAVVRSADLDLASFGFVTVSVEQGAPISASIARGVAAADEGGCDACLIALADMPIVPERHFRALLGSHVGAVTATISGNLRSVPAVFARTMFPELRGLSGDRGAAGLLAGAATVAAEAAWMRDVDTIEDLEKLRIEAAVGGR